MTLRRAVRRGGVATALLAIPAALLVSPLLSTGADAATTTYYVNSTGPSLVAGETCLTDTPAGNCTLTTALTRANALAGTDPVVIQVATGFAGGVINKGACTTAAPNDRMISGLPQAVDATTAYFRLTRANTTIDLDRKLGLIDNDCDNVGGLRIDAPGAVVRDISNFYAGSMSFWVGPNGDNVQFTDLDLRNTATWNPEQAIVIMGGSDTVSITNSQFSGFAGGFAGSNGSAMIGLARDLTNLTAPVANVTVSGNSFTGGTVTAGVTCSSTSGAGCTSRAFSAGPGTVVNSLSITNNTFTNFGSNGPTTRVANQNAIDFVSGGITGVAMSNLTVTGNTFTGSKTGNSYFEGDITLPYLQALGGTNVIANNSFSGFNNQQGAAIYFAGGNPVGNNTTNSNLTIRDNQFAGYGFNLAAMVLWQTGAVKVEKNTFTAAGTLDVSATAETGTTNVLVNNYDISANRKIPAYFPAGTPSFAFSTACQMTVTATRPTSADNTKLAYPLNVDVYWSPTGSTGAERFLGRASVPTNAATTAITVPYPVDLPAGVIRFQTQNGATPTESSQYSRTIPVAASPCPAGVISPTSGPAAGGTSVAVTLFYLPTPSATLTGVSFGGVPGTGLSGSGTSYTVTTPARAPGLVDVVFSYSDGSTKTLTGAYTFIPQPSMSIDKRAFSDAARTQEITDFSVVDQGQTVYWRYTVTNTGQAALTNVVVTDDKLSPTTVCTIASLAVGASTSCTASGAVN